VQFRDFYESDWQAKDGAPPEFDRTFAAREERIVRAIAAFADGRPHDQLRVLDASCGGGSFINLFRRLGMQVVGADISVNAIGRARRDNAAAQFAAASAEEAVPFKDASFDVVWFGETLAHLFDGHAALSEFNRVLKPGGQLILTTPYHGRLKNVAIAMFSFSDHYYPDNYRIRFYDRRSLESALEWAGFKAHTWRGIGRAWPFWKSFFVVAAKTAGPGSPPDRLRPREPRRIAYLGDGRTFPSAGSGYQRTNGSAGLHS
jgi:2-polyprenyl-6-hydroxyphenyl methylase/3-demethylubiquinone-9 3-methyltransferase